MPTINIPCLNTEDYAFSALWTARTKALTLPTVGAPANLTQLKRGFDDYIKDGVKSQKFRSLTIDTSSVETEYAACISAHQQYWWPLELGYVDPVTGLQEYAEKMKVAGIEKVRQALQAQLDAYLKGL